MPCYTQPPSMSENEWKERMLCESLSMLSVEQIESMRNHDGYISTYQWYAEHIYGDFKEAWEAQDKTSMKRYEDEIGRLGGKIIWRDGCPALQLGENFVITQF
jgi:hypothetical protein